MRRPRIGEPRLYAGGEIKVVYPGEVCRAGGMTGEQIEEAIAECQRLAAAGHPPIVEVPIRDWTVEPEPGLVGFCRRLKYRVWGQWLDRFREWTALTSRSDEEGQK